MTTTWPEVALGDICSIQIGKTPARATAAYWGEGHPWLSISDMRQGRFISKTKEMITDLAVTECNCKLAPAGTPLLSFKLSVGKVGMSTIPLYTNEAIAHLPVKDESKLDPTYLCWALESLDLSGSTDRAAMGQTLNKKSLSEIKIPLPPLDEQRRIAAILDKADEVRSKRKAALETLETLSQAIFIEMFGDPVTNPMGWPEVALGEICDVLRGTTITQVQTTPGSIPVIAGGVGPSYFCATANRNSGVVSISASGANAGYVNYWDQPIFASDCSTIESKNSRITDTRFIYHQLKYLQPRFQASLRKGAAQPHVYAKDLANLIVAHPPLDEQAQFACLVAKVREEIRLAVLAIVENDHLFESLQQKAFQGAL